jgi:single-strand DNA-binding protein
MSDQITVVGTVGTVPERRRSGDGSAVINFRLVTTERRRDPATGQWADAGESWYSVSAYRALAENALESLEKGHRVVVMGRLHVRKWEAGEKRGISADIDADALGHDLLWATTRYTRRKRAGDAVAESDEPARQESVPGEEQVPALAGVGAASPAAGEAQAAWSAPGWSGTGDRPF